MLYQPIQLHLQTTKTWFLLLKTTDGKTIRALIHPEDVQHTKNMKEGDKVELFGIGLHGVDSGGMMGQYH